MPSTSASDHQSSKPKRTNSTTNEPTINKIQETNVALFRTYRKLHVKLIRCKHHNLYLMECAANDMVHKTLRSNLRAPVLYSTTCFKNFKIIPRTLSSFSGNKTNSSQCKRQSSFHIIPDAIGSSNSCRVKPVEVVGNGSEIPSMGKFIATSIELTFS